jgi:hypothetical protein
MDINFGGEVSSKDETLFISFTLIHEMMKKLGRIFTFGFHTFQKHQTINQYNTWKKITILGQLIRMKFAM